ncbi:MAG: sodium-dependent bicarbonate transport family permease [Cyclobacteriaceae bacterium]|nr:sodium-dependent bicarbonate transport family permease [Cyclobacteriaceae bacterium]
MSASIIDPVVLFFVLGAIAGIAKSDLRVPESFYHTLSIYLLLSIGIKGGIELYNTSMSNFVWPALGTLVLGVITTILAYLILSRVGKFDRSNSIATKNL